MRTNVHVYVRMCDWHTAVFFIYLSCFTRSVLFHFFKNCYKSYRKSSLYDRTLDCLFQRVSLIGTRQWFIGSASIWCLPQQPAIGIYIRAEAKWTWQSSTTLRSHIKKSHSIGIYSYECPYHESKWVHVLWVPACLPPVSTVWDVAYLLFTNYIDISHKSI